MIPIMDMAPVRLLTLGEGLEISFGADGISLFFMGITTFIF